MNNRKLYYIISLVLFIIGIVVIGVHVNNYRKKEYYADASNMIGQAGGDQSLKVEGRIDATNNNNALGRSFIPNAEGDIVLQPSNITNNIRLQGNTRVAGDLGVAGNVCFGTNTQNQICMTQADMKATNKLSELLSINEGEAIRCGNPGENRGAVFRFTNLMRKHYPNPTIASRYDSNWRNARTVDCTLIPKGDPMQ